MVSARSPDRAKIPPILSLLYPRSLSPDESKDTVQILARYVDVWDRGVGGSIDFRISRSLFSSIAEHFPECEVVLSDVEAFVQEAEGRMFPSKSLEAWEEELMAKVQVGPTANHRLQNYTFNNRQSSVACLAFFGCFLLLLFYVARATCSINFKLCITNNYYSLILLQGKHRQYRLCYLLYLTITIIVYFTMPK